MSLKISPNLKKTLYNDNSSSRGIDLDRVNDSNELIELLMKNNSMAMNEARDKESIRRYLDAANYCYVNNINKMPTVHNIKPVNPNLDNHKASRYGDEGGKLVSGYINFRTKSGMENRGCWDYRVTMRGSNVISTDEAMAFTDALVEEANKRHLTIRMKDPWTHDAVILYINKEELLEVVRLLEDLKNERKYGHLVATATKHFGPVMDYSASVSKDSYYGIAMAHSEGKYGAQPSGLKGDYGGNPCDTFGNYLEDVCLYPAYMDLLRKYNGDYTRISVDEMYTNFIKNHKKYMLGFEFAEEDLPIWMNRRNYNEFLMVNNKSMETKHVL